MASRARPISLQCPSGNPMPIRFRCAYCNQLMGIARRKSGTVVRCPTCSGQVVVPNPDPNDPDEPEPIKEEPKKRGAPQPNADPNLFERSDFDEVLRPGVAAPAATVAAGGQPPPTGAWGTAHEAAMGVERLDGVVIAAPAPANLL